MGMLAGYSRLAVAAIGLLLVTGCGSPVTAPAPAQSTPSTQSTLDAPITVHRTGGIAGVDDKLSVAGTGAWTRDGRSGTLTAEQAKQVNEMLRDPRIAEEARRQAGQTRCRDAFTFEVTIGEAIRVHYVDCPGDPDPPMATMALVEYLYGVTAG